jgi:hypothetical protein
MAVARQVTMKPAMPVPMKVARQFSAATASSISTMEAETCSKESQMKSIYNTVDQHTGSLEQEGTVVDPPVPSLGPNPLRSSDLEHIPGEEPEQPVIPEADGRKFDIR